MKLFPQIICTISVFLFGCTNNLYILESHPEYEKYSCLKSQREIYSRRANDINGLEKNAIKLYVDPFTQNIVKNRIKEYNENYSIHPPGLILKVEKIRVTNDIERGHIIWMTGTVRSIENKPFLIEGSIDNRMYEYKDFETYISQNFMLCE